MNQDIKNKIKAILSSRGNDANICHLLMKQIDTRQPDEIDELMAYISIQWQMKKDFEKTEEAPNVVSDTHIEDYRSKHTDLVKSMLKGLIRQQNNESDFYIKLYNGIIKSPLLPSVEHRALAMETILDSSHVPYFSFPSDGLKMDKQDINKKKNELMEDILKIKFIISRPHTELTQDADLVLNIILKHHKDEDRVVLMSIALGSQPIDILSEMMHGALRNRAQRSNS